MIAWHAEFARTRPISGSASALGVAAGDGAGDAGSTIAKASTTDGSHAIMPAHLP
jgi:hypothetical protein